MTARKKQILIVNNKVSESKNLRSIMAIEGYNIDIVETGTKALESLWSYYYDLILIHSELSDMTGEELERKILVVSPHLRTLLFKGESYNPDNLLELFKKNLRS